MAETARLSEVSCPAQADPTLPPGSASSPPRARQPPAVRFPQHLQPRRCHPRGGRLLTTLKTPQKPSSPQKRSFTACSKIPPARPRRSSHSHRRGGFFCCITKSGQSSLLQPQPEPSSSCVRGCLSAATVRQRKADPAVGSAVQGPHGEGSVRSLQLTAPPSPPASPRHPCVAAAENKALGRLASAAPSDS